MVMGPPKSAESTHVREITVLTLNRFSQEAKSIFIAYEQ